jgi:putative ABC transport system permease protein
VLLIACVNVALLLLATIADRRREIALRTAIGADRRHIVRHVLSESLLVSIGGAALGLALAAAAMPLLRVLVPPLVPRGDETRLDPVVLGMAALVTIATAIVCGIAPAWLAQRHGVQASLRHASGTATPDRHMTLWRRGIVVTQVSVVCVLLVTAGLLLHSFVRMQHVNLGFEDGGLLTMEMRLLNPKYHTRAGRIADFQRQLMERVRALPGVEQASMTTAIPMSGGTDWMYAIRPVGGRARSFANMRVVDHEFFATMRIPLVAGRLFTAADEARTPRVAIVSEQYARALFGDGPPLGRSLDLERDGQAEIVGVVADVRHEDVKKAASPGLYFPRAQMESELISLVVRPASGAGGLPAAIRGVIRELDPEQPIDRVGTIAAILGRNMSEERFYTVTTAGFAATAVLLALVGLTGVVGRTVTERLREIAVRLALGAEPRRLAARAIGHAMLPVIVGLGVGVVAARSASRLLESLLFEVSALDVTTYAVTVVVLAGAAALACYLPARRAMRVEPMSILKSE